MPWVDAPASIKVWTVETRWRLGLACGCWLLPAMAPTQRGAVPGGVARLRYSKYQAALSRLAPLAAALC